LYIAYSIHSVLTDTTVGIAGYFINYAVETWPGTSSSTGSKYLAGAQGAFTVGRFSGALLMKYMRARWVFLIYLSGVVAFLAASITQGYERGIGMLPLLRYLLSQTRTD
jgi:FHS family L-fucose permease-like MFS transporter